MSDIDNSIDKGEKTGEEQLSIHLFDPLCGSGTIAIEAASILAGLPPGRFRPPPLEATTMLNTSLWNNIKSKALSVSTSSNGTENTIMVVANDISNEAIDAAISNAKRAGALESSAWERRNAKRSRRSGVPAPLVAAYFSRFAR